MTGTIVDAYYAKSPWRHVSTHRLHLSFITQGDGLAAAKLYLVVQCVHARGCSFRLLITKDSVAPQVWFLREMVRTSLNQQGNSAYKDPKSNVLKSR